MKVLEVWSKHADIIIGIELNIYIQYIKKHFFETFFCIYIYFNNSDPTREGECLLSNF